MKSNAILLSLLSAADVASAVKFVSGPEGWPAAMRFNTTEQTWEDVQSGPGVIRAPAPKRMVMKSRVTHIPNVKSVKIRYGPYTVPAPMVAGGEGMVWNSPNPSIEKPCTGKCTIVGMNAGLEFGDGTDANTDQKMWLHHMVLFNIGSNAWDATCTVFGLPHMIVGSLPATSERIFSSGNERTMIPFNHPETKKKTAGYPIFPSDRFGLIADLMNMNPQSKQVWMTMYYDFVEDHPAGWDEVKPVWFDVAQCGTSEVGGGQAGANFKIASGSWTASFDGEVMGVGGHIHDGGINLEVLQGAQVSCNSQARYASAEESKKRAAIVMQGGYPSPELPPNVPISAAPAAGGMPAGGHDHAGGQHIVAMGVCGEIGGYNGSPKSPLKIEKVVKGQPWKIQAYYDYKQFNGMKNNRGGMDTVMGIAIMFVRTKGPMRLAAGGSAPPTAAAGAPATGGKSAAAGKTVPAGAVPNTLFASSFNEAGLDMEYA
ncbi:hypothetical protein E2P81_ATG07626 [Venturia nashicola]|uniref:Uncharacterized protein n=1 Tax=Venturia nashicola TaxID=86259 RepID=A0A4Z1PCS6_9PEZI|nr:hypothetical protein E6O75_ATG07784 [Venturia nashicola]TLD32136.1 hypothetical protein E2P81_ATG07626 [Venturia nashicola]